MPPHDDVEKPTTGALRTRPARGLSPLTVLSLAVSNSGALRQAMIGFLLAYNVRFGMALALRLVTLAMSKPRTLLDLGEILSEKHLHFREEAVRSGLFVGIFAGVYLTMKELLRGPEPPASPSANAPSSVSASSPQAAETVSSSDDDVGAAAPSASVSKPAATTTTPDRSKWWHAFASGSVAGLSLVFMDKSWHRTLALYMATRAAQCFYNFSKARGYFHFWGSSWAHGDSLLFGLSSAQIMYSYVCRPNALPPSYYSFIRRQGPLDEVVLQAVRDNCRGKPVNTDALFAYVKEQGGSQALRAVQEYFPDNTKFPRLIPLRAMHPYTEYCSVHTAYAFWNVAKQIFGVYFSLAIAPAIVLRFQHFIKQPLHVLQRCLVSACWSTLFLASFCSSYQAFVCVQRHVLDALKLPDHKLWYYVAGCFSSFAIFFEQKSRRSELALYAFPRAADALYAVLYDRNLIFSVPQGELLLFALSVGLIMHFHEHERTVESPLVAKVLERFLPDDVLYKLKHRRIRVRVGKMEKSLSSFELGELRQDTDTPVVESQSLGAAASPGAAHAAGVGLGADDDVEEVMEVGSVASGPVSPRRA